MDKVEIEIKWDENTKNDIAEKLEPVSNSNEVTKDELLYKFVAKDVVKDNMITVAVQMFLEYEKELEKSNQTIKRYKDYVSDNKIKNDILEKSCRDNLKGDTRSEKDVISKNISIKIY